MPPLEMIETYSADAVRYWSASTGFGKDSVISEDKIQSGDKLVTKLWNVARFSSRFVLGIGDGVLMTEGLTPADRWILSRTARLVQECTASLEAYDYASAKSAAEVFFWHDLADNYLEMAKMRLYEAGNGAVAPGDPRLVLRSVLKVVLALFAPYLPHVTEEIWQHLFAATPWTKSLHSEAWPAPQEAWIDGEAEALGTMLVEVATAVRRYKSEHALSLGTELEALMLVTADDGLAGSLLGAAGDLRSVTRARMVVVGTPIPQNAHVVLAADTLQAAIVSPGTEG